MCHLVVAESVVLPAQHSCYGRSIRECSHDVSIVPGCSVQSSDAEFSDDRAVLGWLHCSSRDTQCLSLLSWYSVPSSNYPIGLTAGREARRLLHPCDPAPTEAQ